MVQLLEERKVWYMVAREKSLTMEDFKAFIARSENADRLFEFINGKIIEVSPGRTINSWYREIITVAVHLFCRENNLPCFTSAGDGAYDIQGHTVAPDFAYKRTPMSDEYPDPVAPLWAVEVVSPTDKAPAIRAKRRIYQQAGILLWEMYPDERSIDVYPPGKPMRTLGVSDTLDGGDVLPGFTLPVRNLFGPSA
jgi:Uma2 family endonuclease